MKSRKQKSKKRSKQSTKTRASIPRPPPALDGKVPKPKPKGRPRKLKPLTIPPVQGRKKVYCGDLAYLPSDEYERAGTRRECLDKGYGAGRATEYNYLRERLQETGYLLPERSYNRSTKKDDYEIV